MTHKIFPSTSGSLEQHFQIADRMYARHDGTRSYFFNIEEMKKLASESGLEVENISYCERMTVNKKENVEAKRLFLQARFLDLNFSPSL